MERHMLVNGYVCREDALLISDYCKQCDYSDSVVETMRVSDGNMMKPAFHFERLWRALLGRRFLVPSDFTPAFLEEEILRLCRTNHHEENARITLTVFRIKGSVNDPVSNYPNYIVQSWPLGRQLSPTRTTPDARANAVAAANSSAFVNPGLKAAVVISG